MSKKKYTLYLSLDLARKFDATAKRNGAKSALVEEALKLSLSPQQVPGIDDALARRLNFDDLSAQIAQQLSAERPGEQRAHFDHSQIR